MRTRILRTLLCAVALLGLVFAAQAQDSGGMGGRAGPVNNARILAALGYTPVNKTGDVMTGTLNVPGLYDTGNRVLTTASAYAGSVTNSDGSLTVSPTTGAVIASINYGHAGTWTASQVFSAGITGLSNLLSIVNGTNNQTLNVYANGNAATAVWLQLGPGGSGAASLISNWSSGLGAPLILGAGANQWEITTAGALTTIGGSGAFSAGTGNFTGKVTTVASAVGGAGLNLPPGAAPTSPSNGDVWTTSAGYFVRINGATIGPLGAPTVLRGYIEDLTLSNDGTSPNTVLDIAAGEAADTTTSVLIMPGAFTKSTAGAWASGSGANGMGNGLTIAAATWYDVCLANNNGTPDYWFDTSNRATSYSECANRPSGITDTKYRRVGSFLTDASSHILKFWQNGNSFTWDTPQTDGFTSLATNANTKQALSFVPSGFSVTAVFSVNYNGTGSNGAYFYSGQQTALAALPNTTRNLVAVVGSSGAGGGARFSVQTDNAQNIQVYNAITGSPSTPWLFVTDGWVDARGANN